MRFAFIDGEKLCLYQDGKVIKEESGYITKYREKALAATKNKEWKSRTDRMISDEPFFDEENGVRTEIFSICPYFEEDKLIYAFSVDSCACVYLKYLQDEKGTEAHVVSSNEVKFGSVSVSKDGQMLFSVKKGYGGDIALLSANGDYKRVTGGDSLDENPYLTRSGNILFNSFAIGRYENNEFCEYISSAVYLLKTGSLEMQTVLEDESGKYSFVKPQSTENELYCICCEKEKEKRQNIFLSILLIPVRILQAIVGFISLFVTLFTGKPLVGGNGKTRSGLGAAKAPKDGRTVALNNYVFNVNEQLKRNAKEADGGFVPKACKLVKLPFSENEFFGEKESGLDKAEVLASGVADFVLIEENGKQTVVYTNGKHIFALQDGRKRKLLDVDFCIRLGAVNVGGGQTGLFDRL